jgi:enoyl-CoA hydratase/carnithine racemase
MRHVRIEHDAPVTHLVLARSDRRNALSLELIEEMLEALRRLPDDSEVVLVCGEGPSFSAGHDLAEMLDRERSYYDELFDACVRLMEGIHRTPQPVIARVHGPATAAGCQLVASCDLAVASDDAWFATPGVKIGLFCATPMVPLVRSIGRKRAMEMLLTGRPIDAATAASWGLVNRAVPPHRLDDEIDDLVGAVLASSRRVIARGKETFYAQADLDESGAYDLTKVVMASSAGLPDAQEGMRAFLERRPPVWPEDDARRAGEGEAD